jgi:hypothetical protein
LAAVIERWEGLLMKEKRIKDQRKRKENRNRNQAMTVDLSV